MSQNNRILIVEDERDLAELLAYNLQKAGYQVTTVHDGKAAIERVRRDPPDLVLLDIMLPGVSGHDVARDIRTNPRTSTLPIIMLTARAEEAQQLTGLAAGADDYIAKPFSTKILLARVHALLRRVAPAGGAERLEVGPIVADLSAHQLTLAGTPLVLTLTEFKLLVALMQQHGKVLSRADLIARVIGPDIVVTTRTIDVHIASIRKKLGRHGGMIRTIRGVGYQLVMEPAATPEPEGVT